MIRFFELQISKWTLLLLAGDLFVYSLSVFLGIFLDSKITLTPWDYIEFHLIPLLLIGLVYIIVLYIADLYDHYLDYRLRENIGRVLLAAFFGAIVIIILFYFPAGPFIGRIFLFHQALLFAWLLATWRYLFSLAALPIRLRRSVLIVGAGRSGSRLLQAINRRANSGLNVVGFVDDDPLKVGTVISGVPVLGFTHQLPELIKAHKIGLVIIAITHEKSSPLLMTLARLSFTKCPLTDMPTLYEFITGKVPIEHVSNVWFFLHSLNKSNFIYRHVKRVMDLSVALLGLAFTWPLLLFIALGIRLDSSGPVFFRQQRLGYDGQPFQIIKFRTMIQHDGAGHPQWATKNDPRITRFGRFLRKTHLDELPQLINIFKGQMSLVGPRAEWDAFALAPQEKVVVCRPGRRASDPPGTVVEFDHQEKVPFYSFRLVVRPGVTGWAQVCNPYTGSSEAELTEKLQYDLYYIKNMGALLDLAIMLKTIRTVFFGQGR